MWSLEDDGPFTAHRDDVRRIRPLAVTTTCWSQRQLRDASSCFNLRRRMQRLPQLRCSQSPRATQPCESCNMTGLKISFGLEPRESTPLMRIDPHPRTATCRSRHRPPLRLMVLRPCRFAFSEKRDQPPGHHPGNRRSDCLSEGLQFPDSAHPSSCRRSDKPSHAFAESDVIRP